MKPLYTSLPSLSSPPSPAEKTLFYLTRRKTSPFRGGYKARLDWNFCLSAFCVLAGDTAAGHAVSACGETVRPGGTGGWFEPVKFPTWECLRRKPSLVPLGSLVEAGTRSGLQSQDCLRWESPPFREGRMSTKNIPTERGYPQQKRTEVLQCFNRLKCYICGGIRK